jgi:tRNA threonylcarbamoyl adenosine modification protein (Sua5/YciO/YrdC/YwlC family)
VVAVPTDTVYGLAAALPHAEKIQGVKGRSSEKAIPVLCLAEHLNHVTTADLHSLVGTLWPGPLTVAVPAVSGLNEVLVADDGTVGVRVPEHAVLAEILAGGPLAVSSANRAGEPPATVAEAADLPGVAGVVDDGPSPGGVASTVVRWADGAILRPGPVSAAAIEAVRSR